LRKVSPVIPEVVKISLPVSCSLRRAARKHNRDFAC
jgi:hypothetical protein